MTRREYSKADDPAPTVPPKTSTPVDHPLANPGASPEFDPNRPRTVPFTEGDVVDTSFDPDDYSDDDQEAFPMPVDHYRPILCLDFDGVLHSYTSGWRGVGVVGDPPTKGAMAWLGAAVQHFTVAIYSSRSDDPDGRHAMQVWLVQHLAVHYDGLPVWYASIQWPTTKPAALVTLDDRAVQFTGEWPDILTLRDFKPWYKREPQQGN